MKRWTRAALLTVIAVLGIAQVAYARTITSLSATNAPMQGQSVTITASVLADNPVQPSSNLYYQIIAPDGVTVVQTHRTTVPSLQHGDTFSDSWSTNNSSFPQTGNYTVTACWSRQDRTDCRLDFKETTFYSVPAVGLGLGIFGLGLFGAFIWKRRDMFSDPDLFAGAHEA
ncbi:MAG: hypothetical protein JXA97_13800 [Anaerolineales bacterium]|nr:hypothetical protein [Anaerolineales bacterium]